MIRTEMGKQKPRYELTDASTSGVLIQDLETADSFWGRFAGLQLRQDLPKGKGLLLVPCASIHTCFMCFSLDLVFLDKTGKVLEVKQGIAPWRAVSAPKQTYAVLEVRSGNLGPVQIGARLSLRAPAGAFIRPSLSFLNSSGTA